MKEDCCVIWSIPNRAWWRANSSGYTTHVTAAGVYSREEAISISKSSRDGWRSDSNIPGEIPVRVADLPAFARAALAAITDEATP